MKKAFTLVELMIVVSILGILGAIVLPAFGDHIQQAKEAAAKDNLRILRETIGRYAINHNDVPPGYANDDQSISPTGLTTTFHLKDGYLSAIPDNPINGLSTIFALSDGTNFPVSADDSTGWLYKPSTKVIKLNSTGTDSEGTLYFNY